MTPMQKVEVLRAACCVAGIDGEVEDSEKVLLDKIAKEVGVGKASLTAMIERASTDPDFHRQQLKILNEDPQKCLAVVIQVAMADGDVAAVETKVLRSLAGNLGVSDQVFDGLMESVSKML